MGSSFVALRIHALIAACTFIPFLLTVSCACDCNTTTVWSALAALYDSTNGTGWSSSTNWLHPNTTVCEWQGVTCTTLYLRRNGLAGTLPSELQYFTSITRFDVSYNNLFGSLPPEYSAWGSMQMLDVRENRFTGTLPASYGNWSRMEEYYVCLNRYLTGTLPDTYGTWRWLTTFHVHDTALGGTLPLSFASWTRLSLFYADDADLNGTIPSYIRHWTSLSEFHVANNNFTKIGSPDIFKTYLSADLSGNLFLEGSLSLNTMSLSSLNLCGTQVTVESTTSNSSDVLSVFNCSEWRAPRTPVPWWQYFTNVPNTTTRTPVTNVPNTTTRTPVTIGQTTTSSPTPQTPTAVNLDRVAADVGTVAVGVSSAVGMTMQLTNLAGGGMGALGSLQVSMGASRIAARVKKCSQGSENHQKARAAQKSVAVDNEDVDIGSLFADSPLRLQVPPYKYSVTLGTVVGNIVMFVGAPIVMAAAAGVYWFVEYIWRHHHLLPVSDLFSQATILRIWSKKQQRMTATVAATLFSVVGILQTPTVAASVFLVLHAAMTTADDDNGIQSTQAARDRIISALVGAIGLLVCCAPVAFVAFLYRANAPLRGRRLVRHRAESAPSICKVGRCSGAQAAAPNAQDWNCSTVRGLDDASKVSLISNTTKGRSLPGRKQSIAPETPHACLSRDIRSTPTAHEDVVAFPPSPTEDPLLDRVQRFLTYRDTQWDAVRSAEGQRLTISKASLAFLLRPCAYPHSWQVFVDVGVGLLQGALNGVASYPFLSCDGVAAASWTLCAVCFTLVVYAVVLRGRSTHAEILSQVTMHSLTSAAMLAAALGDQDSSNIVSLAQASLELVTCIPVLSVWKAARRWCSGTAPMTTVAPTPAPRTLKPQQQQSSESVKASPPAAARSDGRTVNLSECTLDDLDDDEAQLASLLGVSPKKVVVNKALEQRQRLRQLIQKICTDATNFLPSAY